MIVFIYPVDPDKDFIKRVIGLPGDRVEMNGETVYINGEPYDDQHAFYGNARGVPSKTSSTGHFGPVTVPKGHLFVMGDNRNHSYDSRFWGFVPMSSVKGKAFIIYWSWPHWKRFLHLVN